jgi:alpha/beta superfamily hydrolase
MVWENGAGGQSEATAAGLCSTSFRSIPDDPSTAGFPPNETGSTLVKSMHFGDPGQPLFGLLHQAAGQQRQTAILICPPWGMEYLRAYRGLRQLAETLAAIGFTTLRFDYHGTGDSAGDGRDVTLAGWIADIGEAARQLRETAGAVRLALLGLRCGALLAQQAVAEGLEIDALALWDAPPSGAVYIENLQHLDQAASDARNRYRSPRAQLPPAAPDELLGHDWPPALAAGLSGLAGLRRDLPVPLQVFVSRDRTPPEGIASLRLPDAGHWSDIDRLAEPWNSPASCAVVARHLAEALP